MIELLNEMDQSEAYGEITAATFQFQFSVQQNRSQISDQMSDSLDKDNLRFEIWDYFPSPLTRVSESCDINKYAGLSTDHMISGMSSHEIAIAIFPFFE